MAARLVWKRGAGEASRRPSRSGRRIGRGARNPKQRDVYVRGLCRAHDDAGGHGFS